MPDKTVDIFITKVNGFLKENPDKLIGVHCTHGLNRTGYLVCRYFIQENKMTAKNAMETFETARGHQMVYEWVKNHLYKVASHGGEGQQQNRNAAGGMNKHSKWRTHSEVPTGNWRT